MIPGSKGPIIFPFKSIDRQVLTINRNQLVQHNSHIAILAITTASSEASIPSVEGTELPKEADSLSPCPLSSESMLQHSNITDSGTDISTCICCVGAASGIHKVPSVVPPEKFAGQEAPQELPRLQEPIVAQSSNPVNVQLKHCTVVSSNGKFEEPLPEHVVGVAKELPQPQPFLTQNQMLVSKLDACDYLQWQWEKLVVQLDELNVDYPDESNVSMSELADELPPLMPVVISEEALRMYKKSKELDCPEWANRFILLIGHRILTISKGHLFLNLTVNEVCEILSSDFLDVINERSVFRAANRWLDYDAGNRTQHATHLLGCVRYGLMSKVDLLKFVVTRRRLNEAIAAMPPFQLSLTNGLIWMALADLELEENYPEFSPVPRIHSGLPPHRYPIVGAEASLMHDWRIHPEPLYHGTTHHHNDRDNGKCKGAIHLNAVNHGGHHHGRRGGHSINPGSLSVSTFVKILPN